MAVYTSPGSISCKEYCPWGLFFQTSWRKIADEIFVDNERADTSVTQSKFVFAETDSLFQVLQFYLQVNGKDFFLADKLVSYGCWCQIRNQAAQGIVPGELSIQFLNGYKGLF